jgi:hypothetical protein
METSLTSFKSQLRDALLAFLWRQWSALGVSGHARTDDPWLIDPESLLLFSTVVARHDARLFDEILDWLHLHADLLNLQRLSRLQKDHAIGDASVLAAIASQLTRDKAHPKWRALVTRATPPPAHATPRPLFPHLPAIGRGDDTWLAWGWQRPPVELRGLSQPPRPDQPATFLFKLRALFGLQTRAEVVAWLLAHDTGHPAEIARATGYFRSSIQGVLNELATSGHVFSVRTGREKHFGLRREEWRFLLTWPHPDSSPFPHWVDWPGYFAALRRVFDLVEHPRLDAMSANLQAIELLRALDAARLAKDSQAAAFAVPAGETGTPYLDFALKELRALLG